MRRVFLFLALALVALFAVGLTQANEAEWTTDGIEFVSSLSDVMPDHDVESAFMEMTSHADVDVDADADADAETEVDAGVDTDADMESEAETETESEAETEAEAEAESEATPSIISRVTNAINALRPNTVATAGDSQYEETPDTSNPTAAELAKMNADAHKKCFAGTFVGVCHTAGEVCDGVYNTGACGGGELCCLPRQAPANVAAVAAPMALFVRAAPAQVCGARNVGSCKERAVGCAGGYFQAGLCAGAASVQCCIPTASPSPAPAAPAPAPAASSTGICSKAAAMANLAVRRGLPASKGKCAKYVGDYIQSQLPSYARTLYARDIGANLLKAGFKALPQGSRLLPGDVRVIQPIPGHSAGHAQMYVGAAGAMWISDFKQRDEWPGSAWRNNPANIKHTTYRYSC